MSPRARRTEQRPVLLALLGMSPAVLTETVWSLAHEKQPVIPTEIVVLTTVPGRKRLIELLFDGGKWRDFCEALAEEGVSTEGALAFGRAAAHIRLFPRPGGSGDLEDISTAEESEAAADFIMGEVRRITSDPGTRLMASIAGGRKTMGALLTSCMSILGREQDRLCHVLVSPPFENPRLDPPFLYPKKAAKHFVPDTGKHVDAERAHIDLTDIPFLRLRGLYEREFKKAPPSYMNLVTGMQDSTPAPRNYPVVNVDKQRGRFLVGKNAISLSDVEFTVMSVLFELWQEGVDVQCWDEIADRAIELKTMRGVAPYVVWFHDFCASTFANKDDVKKAASRVRRKLREQLEDSRLADIILPSFRGRVEPYPQKKIRIKDFQTSADVKNGK